LTAELDLRKLDRNQKFLKKNLDSKPEISVESEQKNMNALLSEILTAELELRKLDRNQKFR